MRRFAFIWLLVLSACGPSSAPGGQDHAAAASGVHLSAAEVASLGIRSVPVRAASFQPRVEGYGVVVPLDTIAQADSDIRTAAAMSAQSAAAAARAHLLVTGAQAAVSREMVEAADAKAAADGAALALARRKADALFGLHPPWHSQTQRAALMARLASGQSVLVRLVFPLGVLPAGVPSGLAVAPLESGAGWTAKLAWDAPADPGFPGRSLYALVDGSTLAQNAHVTATVPSGAPLQGVMIPAQALVMGEGASWVYLQTAPGRYRRVAIDATRPLDGGYFVAGGIAPGQRVVTDGAGLLLAHETNPGGDTGD